MLLVTAASVLDTSEHVDEAHQLIEFLLGEQAQRYFAEETLEYPLAAGVEPAEGLPPLDGIVSVRIGFDALGDLGRTLEMINESGLQDQ
jgi:iron(III) transport system substrate-binding protein